MRFMKIAMPIAALALLGLGLYFGLVWSPPDREMGDVYRIMYLHVPANWMWMLAYSITFFCSLAFLFRARPGFDAVSEAAAEVGIVFNAIGLITGSIWGKPTWGIWWTWDPRLTWAAVTLVLYAGYLALRRFTDDPDRRASWAAVVGIISYPSILITYKAVEWWRTLHQTQSTPKTVDPPMVLSLRTNAFAFLAIMICLIYARYRIGMVRRRRELAGPDALGAAPVATGAAR